MTSQIAALRKITFFKIWLLDVLQNYARIAKTSHAI